MSVKERIVELLEANKGQYLSGEKIASYLAVSRAAVWKAIKSLQEEGYVIEAAPNKGYLLSESSDVLSAIAMARFLRDDAKNLLIKVQKSLESTNSTAKKEAVASAVAGTVIISEEQTAGRGRLGRSFFSPSRRGIYMSMILRPQMQAEEAMLLTTIAAVAVAEAIESVCDKKARIKWVNDIYVDEKKVCGILTEAAFDIESSSLQYVVVGIGINVFEPEQGYPQELKDIATALFAADAGDKRNQLAAEVLNRFMSYYANFAEKEFVSEYQRRSLVIGRRIMVIYGKNTYPAVAVSIDDDCHLHVRLDDGSEKILSSGEISIRIA
jgi:BirA family biotin operon repressor/biotin-[acetyl-CoA-carboxylase] ligase